MIDEPHIDDPGDDVLAAEFALGLLDGEELRAAHARLLGDRAFAADVAAWQERLSGLADGFDPVPPPAGARAAIEKRLFGAAPTPGLGLWKALAGFATVAAAAFAFLAFLPQNITPPALFVSDIVAEDGSLSVLAVVDATAHTLRVTRTTGSPEQGRALEIWGIPADGTPPVSFGVLPESGTTVFQVPDALLGKAVGLTLAISDEPAGGSPTGQPTGAILATGPALQI